MDYKPLKYTMDYLRNLYDSFNNLAQNMGDSMTPSYGYSGLERNIVDVYGGFYQSNGAEYGSIGQIFLFAKPKSRGRRPRGSNLKGLHKRYHRPTHNSELLLGNNVDDLINWQNVKDPERKAKLIIMASKLSRDNPLYGRVPIPTGEEKKLSRERNYGSIEEDSSGQVGYPLSEVEEDLNSKPKDGSLMGKVKLMMNKLLIK